MENVINSLGGYIYEYQKSVLEPENFWERIAKSFYWRSSWNEVLDWDFSDPTVSWFKGATLNITENIFERRLYTHADNPALYWEPNSPEEQARSFTYKELYDEVCRFSNALRRVGVSKGDRVVIYMPLVPEAAVAMLACARVGAVHSVVFAGFSASALSDRVRDCGAKVVITADEGYRGAKTIPLKKSVDEALESTPSVERCVVLRRTGGKVEMTHPRDVWWHVLMESETADCSPVEVDSEHPLFILYTSGSTGAPKGVVHSTGGYMVYTAYSFQNVFQYRPHDIFWCTADIGWITGHSYVVYGPLLSGGTILMYEGTPVYPHPGRFWEIIDKYKVSQFYTAPTAIRSLQAYGIENLESYSLESLKVIGTVGEPINDDAWHWYHLHIGKGKCPVVDTWWQTETGGIMISPLAGITPTKPAYATLPLPGIQPVIVNDEGLELRGNSVEGNLCIKFPWPGMIRTTYGNHARCKDTYFSRFPGLYFTGDGVKRDEDGYYRILGRVDDVINVSGHRLGTAEIENALNEHPRVLESAVVGVPHAIKGESILAFVVCSMENRTVLNITQELKATVAGIIGPIARPEFIVIVDSLPKTRSGKIMRRILRKIGESEREDFGDTSTLIDPLVIGSLIEKYEWTMKNLSED